MADAIVINLFSRTAHAARPGSPARAAREQLDLSREELAASLNKWLNGPDPIRPGMIAQWEDGTEMPDEVAEAYRKLQNASPLATAPVPAIMLPSGAPGFEVSELGARRVIEWVESTNTSDDAIGYFTQAVAKIAEEHAALPPSALLAKAGRLHAMMWELLEGGRQQQHQIRELLHLDADLLAHLCQLLGDVQRDREAFAYARAAVALAGEAGSGPAPAFSAQSQIARWRGRHAEAAELAALGSRSGPPAHLRTLLAYQEANAAAAAGQRHRARAVLDRADGLDDDSVSYSAWSCPPARRVLYRMGVALNLGEPREALQLAAEAEPMWLLERSRAFGTWAHFQIATAKAHVMLASVDGAAEQIAPVLNLSQEYRISTLAAHTNTLSALLSSKPVRDARQAISLRQQLRQFSNHAPTQLEDQ
jgi:DNA-binding transcriptional regulator YiaG